MKKYLITVLSICWSLLGYSQVVLIQEDVNADTVRSESGPNSDRYTSSFYSFGMIFGKPDAPGSSIDSKASFHLQFGSRIKIKVNNVLSWGLENMMDYKSFRITQNSNKTFTDSILHKKESFLVFGYSMLLFTRINIDPNRGETLGKYFDLGVYGGVNLLKRHKTVDTTSTAAGYDRYKVIHTNLKYVEWFNYGVSARIGWWGLSAYINYRLSDIFKPYATLNYQELPRFEAGLNFDIESYEWRDNYMRRKKTKRFEF